MFIELISMEKTIDVPDGVDVAIHERAITVKGPKGELKRDFDNPRYNKIISMSKSGNTVKISSESDKRKIKAVIGTISKHVNNMIIGVTNGFTYKMKIHYSHFPISISVNGNEVHIKNFIGEKSARIAKIRGNTSVDVQKDEVKISGTDIEDAGQTAANIEQACKLTKRDRRIFQDGIYISEKAVQGAK